MLGAKHSLSVVTAGGVVVYKLPRKYRALVEQGGTDHRLLWSVAPE
jgi:hypothetical protein